MKKIKVLHVSPSGQLYGTERHILSILKFSDRNLFEHWVASPELGNFTSICSEIGVNVIIAGRKPNLHNNILFSSVFCNNVMYKLLIEIKKHKFDIVHCHLNSYAVIAAKLAGVKFVFHTRHGVFWTQHELRHLPLFNRFFQYVKSKVFNISIAIGEYEKNTMKNYLGYKSNKIRLTFNGVDTVEIRSQLNSSSKESLFKTNKILVGAVGRFERQKGFDLFIKVASLVCSKNKDIYFVLIGDGSQKKHLQDLSNQLCISDNMFFLDYKINIFDYINALDIIVQTSLWEGISYSILEPMALSKPVIAFFNEDTTGIQEIIVNGVSGYTIPDYNLEAMSEKILEFAGDSNLRNNVGSNAYIRVKDFFEEKRTCIDMEKYYIECF